MIVAENIEKRFGELKVLKGVSLKIKKSEIVAVVGSSGAGKTTLLQILGTLLHTTRGGVIINGSDITLLSENNFPDSEI
jgi:lipoprotein-releasing system ATP-binding protein